MVAGLEQNTYGAAGSVGSLRIPYFASVEYSERPIFAFFVGGCTLVVETGYGATAWSNV